MAKVRTDVFVCTPDLVGSWLFYPAWLCMPGLYPKQLVLDYADVDRSRREARSINRTPYDIASWDTLDSHVQDGFVICHYRKFVEPRTKPLRYETIAGKRLGDLRETANAIVRDLSMEQKQKLVENGYRDWKRFGLELKKHLKRNDPVFEMAIDKTDQGIHEIANRGNLPLDPDRLIRRYLMKLQIGLLIRNEYAGREDIPLSRVRVFDTPEYKGAAEHLGKRLGLEEGTFAIPSSSPHENEAILRDILHMEQSQEPVYGRDLGELYEAIDEVKERQDAGMTDKEIETEIWEEVDKAKRETNWAGRIQEAGLLGANYPIWKEAMAAITGGQVDAMAAVVGLAPFLAALMLGQRMVSGSLSDYSSSAKFIVSRTCVRKYDVWQTVSERWLHHLTSLARRCVSRPVTAERISRQMMEPWIDNPVWYDPDEIPTS